MQQARQIIDLTLHKAQEIIQAHSQELGALDAAAGDGDHGATMVRGLVAANRALAELDAGASPGMALAAAGSAFADAAGGASGALFGLLLMTAGQKLGSGPFDLAAVHAALDAAAASVAKIGKARVGDKTMLDALAPFVEALGQAAAADGASLAAAWPAALAAAQQGAASTAGMVARKGRASRLGERSRDGLDPGAVSMCYLLQAAGEALAELCPPGV